MLSSYPAKTKSLAAEAKAREAALINASNIGTALMVFFPTTFVPTTSYRTHAIGFAVGVATAILYYLRHKKEIRAGDKYKTVVFEDHSNSLANSP